MAGVVLEEEDSPVSDGLTAEERNMVWMFCLTCSSTLLLTSLMCVCLPYWGSMNETIAVLKKQIEPWSGYPGCSHAKDSEYKSLTLVLEINYIRQPERQLPWCISNLAQLILQPQLLRTSSFPNGSASLSKKMSSSLNRWTHWWMRWGRLRGRSLKSLVCRKSLQTRSCNR